jgi:hypothetical protein
MADLLKNWISEELRWAMAVVGGWRAGKEQAELYKHPLENILSNIFLYLACQDLCEILSIPFPPLC